MPRYYFNLTDRNQTVADGEGMELAGDAAAREEARLFARDLAERKVMNERDWSGWAVAIADERGQHIDSVPIARFDSA
jgi:Domain of unknown function (DUF6894)